MVLTRHSEHQSSARPQRPRILQVISDDERRGAQVFAVDLMHELRSFGMATWTVALTGKRGDRYLPVPLLGPERFATATLRALRQEATGADLVVAHGSSTLPACAIALTGSSVPGFIYRNVGDPLMWANTPARRTRVRWMLRRADAVAAIWPGAARALTEVLGVPPDKVHVLPNGRPQQLFPRPDERAREAARRRLLGAASGPVVLYLGALSEEKRVDLAVEAVAGLDDVHLMVVGDGPQRRSLEALAERVAPRRIRFLGSSDGPAAALAAADALVLPSETEGVPAVLIEAGLMGVPAVATAVGGVGEVVVHGETGVLVRPGDAVALRTGIQTALSQSSTFREAAYQRCLARFELKVVAGEWHRLLTGILNRPGQTARC